MGCQRFGAGHSTQAFGGAAELVFEHGGDAIAQAVKAGVLEAEGDGHMLVDGGQLSAQPCLIGIGDQPLAQLSLDVRRVFQGIVQAAILLQELECGLLANTRHPRDIVRAVAHQALPVHHLLGADAEIILDPGRVKEHGFRDALAGEKHGDAIVHQLQVILVPGQDKGAHAPFLQLP